ncbi:MAG: DUF222 domain-containing protein [Microbacterium sp.]|uniref:HNH endonuclease signature motif containing protein n=1 Tax=Microbacterium sp. TaxID=51671 RepID=UPI0039E4521B
MNALLDSLKSLQAHAAEVSARLDQLSLATESQLVETLALAGQAQRRLDALLIETVGEVAARSASAMREDRMTSRFDCHDVNELVQRTTLVSASLASRYQRASKPVRREASIVTGELLEPMLPSLRQSMLDGRVGVDGVLAVAAPLQAMGTRVDRERVLLADETLAAHARGEGPDAAPPACADQLKMHAQAWAAVLDQDGAEPRERKTMHHRGVALRTPTDRGVPIDGILMPEVAAQLQRIFDAHLSPAAGVAFVDADAPVGDVPLDTRTRAQKQHDALANALSVAVASGKLPTIGGAAPTLIVSASAEDLAAGNGYAHVEGCDEPVALAAAHRVACTGAVQRILLGEGGRIERIGTEERTFNRHQRRAIALRDGGCIIPGCGIPAGWCEIHHVVEYAKGGPTHCDNGVLLCWYHHRFLDWHGWRIRMNGGVPEVRAPAWFDASLRWRRVTSSKVRLKNAVRRT